MEQTLSCRCFCLWEALPERCLPFPFRHSGYHNQIVIFSLQIRGMSAASNALNMAEQPFQLPFLFSLLRHLTTESGFIYINVISSLPYRCPKITVCTALRSSQVLHVPHFQLMFIMFELFPGRYFCECGLVCSFKVKKS